MSDAQAGHGTIIAMELNPVSSPGVFTDIAELNGDINWPGLTRPEDEVTPHNLDIDFWVFGRLGREAFSFSVNFVFDNNTHDHETGLIAMMVSNTTVGLRVRGPGGGANVDEWIGSGKFTGFNETSPVRQGARTADVTFRFSGPMKIDGVIVDGV